MNKSIEPRLTIVNAFIAVFVSTHSITFKFVTNKTTLFKKYIKYSNHVFGLFRQSEFNNSVPVHTENKTGAL